MNEHDIRRYFMYYWIGLVAEHVNTHAHTYTETHRQICNYTNTTTWADTEREEREIHTHKHTHTQCHSCNLVYLCGYSNFEIYIFELRELSTLGRHSIQHGGHFRQSSMAAKTELRMF